jgi:hypothetical protein
MSTELDAELVSALAHALWTTAPYTLCIERLRDTVRRIERAPGALIGLEDVITALREQGLTDARAEATLVALTLGASFEQALDMLEAGK